MPGSLDSGLGVRLMSSRSEAIGAIEPDELIPGRRVSRVRVIAAGLTDDVIERLIKYDHCCPVKPGSPAGNGMILNRVLSI